MSTPTAQPAHFELATMPDVPFGLARPEEAMALSGLEALNGIPKGTFPAPPVARTMNQWIHAASPGAAEFRGEASEAFLNPMGLIHGGWTMTLLDNVLGAAVQTMVGAGESFVSLGTEVKFLRPLTHKTGQVRALGTVQSMGRRTATAEGRVEDSQGRLLATGTTTCFIDRQMKGA